LRTILESVLLDTMYELPNMTNASKVVVDEGVVTGETQPYVIYESEDIQNSLVSEEEPRPTGSDGP
jgi:ATP-dependent Clp protease ATP-binding subunit ClpX